MNGYADRSLLVSMDNRLVYIVRLIMMDAPLPRAGISRVGQDRSQVG